MGTAERAQTTADPENFKMRRLTLLFLITGKMHDHISSNQYGCSFRSCRIYLFICLVAFPFAPTEMPVQKLYNTTVVHLNLCWLCKLAFVITFGVIFELIFISFTVTLKCYTLQRSYKSFSSPRCHVQHAYLHDMAIAFFNHHITILTITLSISSKFIFIISETFTLRGQLFVPYSKHHSP